MFQCGCCYTSVQVQTQPSRDLAIVVGTFESSVRLYSLRNLQFCKTGKAVGQTAKCVDTAGRSSTSANLLLEMSTDLFMFWT